MSFDPEKVERFEDTTGMMPALDWSDDPKYVLAADYDQLLALYKDAIFCLANPGVLYVKSDDTNLPGLERSAR